MKFYPVSRDTSSSSAKRLILFFAGWGMDAAPFATLGRKGYDVTVVWDYREIDFSVLQLDGYSEICVIGWSFGVVAAASFIAAYQDILPITRCIAVAGTLYPVDDTRGIPVAIFEGTLAGLNDRSLRKFNRRMCDSSERFNAFMAKAPARDIQELKDELTAIRDRNYPFDSSSELLFDSVYIPDTDLIIPSDNQRRAWAGHPNVHIIHSGHLVDFQPVLLSEIVGKEEMAGSFSEGATTYDANAHAQHRASERLLALWSAFSSQPSPRVLEIGVGTGAFTRMYLDAFNPADLRLWDIALGAGAGLDRAVECCDAETAICSFPVGGTDAVVGASAIQWFNSPMRFLTRCRRLLPPGGVCVFSTFGPDTFSELHPYQSRKLQYIDTDGWHQIATAAFSDPDDEVCVSAEHIRLDFSGPAEIIAHLRLTGVNAGGASRGIASLRSLLRSGLSSLTYHPIYILLRKAR